MRKSSFWHNLLAITRAYSIPYTILSGLAALGTNQQVPQYRTLLYALTIPVSLAVGLAALNDYLHIHQDAQARRGREYPPELLLSLGLTGSVTTILLALSAGWGNVLGIALSIVSGLGYAYFKSRPGLSNLMRGMTSVAIVLGLAALNQATLSAVVMAIGLGILDAAGNIYGDIRDQDKDRLADIRTIAIVLPTQAPWIANSLFIVSIALLSWYTPFVWFMVPLIIWIWYTPAYWQHRAFLVLKYLLSITLALAISRSVIQTILVCVLSGSIPFCWHMYGFLHSRTTKDDQHAHSNQ